MLLDQNPHQTVTRFGCVGFSMYACVRQYQNELHLKIWFFFAEIGIFCKSIAGPLCEVKTHWMVNWLQLLSQLNFVLRHTYVFMQNSSQWWILRTTVNWCWWRFTHIFCHSSNILGCTHCFCDEDASFFHFFHKITNIRSWLLHTICNIIMIFKEVSQCCSALFKRVHNYIRSAEGSVKSDMS